MHYKYIPIKHYHFIHNLKKKVKKSAKLARKKYYIFNYRFKHSFKFRKNIINFIIISNMYILANFKAEFLCDGPSLAFEFYSQSEHYTATA